MSKPWTLRTELDNRGQPMDVWSWQDYEFSENVNLGDEGGRAQWVFEVLFRGRYCALAPTVTLAKKAAVDHDAEGSAARAAVAGSLETAS